VRFVFPVPPEDEAVLTYRILSSVALRAALPARIGEKDKFMHTSYAALLTDQLTVIEVPAIVFRVKSHPCITINDGDIQFGKACAPVRFHCAQSR
jgi:hypothetical protein